MTKKDYVMLARVIGEAWMGEPDANQFVPIRTRLVNALARELQRDNPKFNKFTFTEAIEKARTGV